MEHDAPSGNAGPSKLGAYLPPIGAWAFAIGASIGWGSLVVTCSTYLADAGPLGSVIGLLIGMGVMLIIAACYHYMMKSRPGTGGIYAYARDVFGYDHGVVVAWFLVLTYLAMFWANSTSLPLFARYFLGDLFQFGPHYQLFGYEVYLGEVMLSIVFIALAGFACKLRKRGVSWAVVAMVAVIVVGIVFCFASAVSQHGATSFSFDPMFAADANALMQVLNIACISSWAFIGFESISHSAGEFSFAHRKSFRVLAIALVTITALYILVVLLSVTAYPDAYGSWTEYIADLGNLQGIQAVPAFYAASYYLGDAGVVILMVVLLCLVFTSLITIIIAVSRLLFSLAEDKVIPESFAFVNQNGVPSRAIAAIVLVSLVMPFLGRTAIGWIVDVTTVGATVIYAFVAACALKDGRSRKNAIESDCGFLGLVIMLVFAAFLLIPGFFGGDGMATESYFILAVWALLGFLFFRHLLRTDKERRFGGSIISWAILLAVTLFTCLAWTFQVSDLIANDTVGGLREHYLQNPADAAVALEDDSFAMHALDNLDGAVTMSTIVVAGVMVFSMVIILGNFITMRRREEESHQRAHTAHTIANTDPLTGVKSKNAFVMCESELNEQLAEGSVEKVGIVVCDVNGLKQVNDTQGHKAGDAYIKAASDLICEFFKHSPVFRIGGDEFVVVLQGIDYDSREQIVEDLNEQVIANREAGEVVVAVGTAVLDPGKDRDIHAVFERADAAMYQQKRKLKGGVAPR